MPTSAELRAMLTTMDEVSEEQLAQWEGMARMIAPLAFGWLRTQLRALSKRCRSHPADVPGLSLLRNDKPCATK